MGPVNGCGRENLLATRVGWSGPRAERRLMASCFFENTRDITSTRRRQVGRFQQLGGANSALPGRRLTVWTRPFRSILFS